MFLTKEQQALVYQNALYSKDKRSGYEWNIVDLGKVKSFTDDFILLCGNCGRGKTTFALDLSEAGLLYQVNKELKKRALGVYNPIGADDVLFLTSRKVIKDQQLEHNTSVILANEKSFEKGAFNPIEEGKIKIATAHAFGRMAKENKVQVMPKLIIVDELHSIFAETIFADDLFYCLAFMRDYEIIKVGLTATPQFLLDYIARFDEINFVDIDITDLGSKYKAKKVKTLVAGSSETTLKSQLVSEENKVLVYLTSARQCYKMAQETPNSAFIVSQYNFTNINGKPLSSIMREQVYEGLNICDYIVKKQKFPAEVNVLFINSASREGINIKDDKVKTVICEAVDMITIEQILGRMRQDITCFYVVFNGRNKTMFDKNLKDYKEFIEEYDREGRDALIKRYGKQEQAKKDGKPIQNYVMYYNGDYILNKYAKAYLQYIDECYKQIQTYKGKLTVGERNLLNREDYIYQLSKYAEDGKVNIEYVWQEAIAKSNANKMSKFDEIAHKYLYKNLNKEAKTRLCEELNLYRIKGAQEVKTTPAKWPTVKKELEKAGYTVEERRTNKERYTIIKH